VEIRKAPRKRSFFFVEAFETSKYRSSFPRIVIVIVIESYPASRGVKEDIILFITTDCCMIEKERERERKREREREREREKGRAFTRAYVSCTEIFLLIS